MNIRRPIDKKVAPTSLARCESYGPYAGSQCWPPPGKVSKNPCGETMPQIPRVNWGRPSNTRTARTVPRRGRVEDTDVKPRWLRPGSLRPVTRLSGYFLPTLRDDPADAEALSHRLMVRAGLIRQIGAGLWTYLPAGYRVIRKVEAIVREEIDAIGGQEMLMPVLQPAENWKRSGRYWIDELFKLRDRKDAEHVLALSHEEAITHHVAREVRSYRELPMILFHIQTKERDEPRPRAGVLRTREFTMKDSYSFDRDTEGLERSYALHIEAYDRIFDRCGLRWYRVESDVGMMGGSGAHEYLAPCAAGENDVALAPGYAANVEIASAEAQPVELPASLGAPEEVDTPGLTRVEEVAEHLGLPAGAFIKALPIVVEGRGLVLIL